MPGTPAVTPRLGLTRYAPGDAATFVAYLNDIVDDLDAQVPPIIHPANFAALPAAGIIDRLAWVDDKNVLYRDTGSVWEPATVADLAIVTAKLADGAVTAAKIAGDVGLAPIGAIQGYAGSGDPAGGNWLLADGRLVDKTTYAAFFTAIGHAYNGGVDPGGNMVRIPDLRGRVLVGQDNMGTALGAAGRMPASNRARGQNGGEERHLLTGAESGTSVHAHGDTLSVSSATIGNNPGTHVIPMANGVGTMSTGQFGTGVLVPYNTVTANWSALSSSHVHGVAGAVSNAVAANASAAHNNLQPYEVSNAIVRVA